MSITRRRAAKMAAVATLAAAVAEGRVAELPSRNRLFARMRGGPQGQAGLWWFAGALWGKRSLDAAKQLFAVEGCSYNTLLPDPDGGLRMNMIEVGFWLDPHTRKPADDWMNPLNGLRCAPVHFMGPQALVFDAAGHARLPNAAPPGLEFSGQITEPLVSGESVWVGETLIVKGPQQRPDTSGDPLQSGLPVFTATSLDMYQATRRDLALSEEQWLAATRSYQTLGSWYPWMRMGHEAGGISFQMIGRKLRTLAELPAGLRSLIEERHSGWFKQYGS